MSTREDLDAVIALYEGFRVIFAGPFGDRYWEARVVCEEYTHNAGVNTNGYVMVVSSGNEANMYDAAIAKVQQAAFRIRLRDDK